MPVFKTYMKVVNKNIFMAFIYTGIFLLLTFLFSSNTEPVVDFEDTSLWVTVIDEDNSEASKALTEYIAAANTIVEIENNKDEILDALYYTRIDYALNIGEGFEEKLMAGETENLLTNYQVPDSYDGVFLDNKINHYISTISAYLITEPDMKAAIAKTSAVLSETTAVTVETFGDKMISTEDFPSKLAFFFNYLPYGLLSVLISVLSAVLIRMNSKEIAARTNVSSTPMISQTAQILLGSFVLVAAVWVIFMAGGMALNGGMFTGRAWYAVLNGFIFTAISAGIAILISTLVNNIRYIAMIANIISLAMSFLCGIFVEQSMLGESVLSVARFLPAYWYIKANDMLAQSTAATFDSGEFMTCLGIECLFAAAIYAVILVASKIKHSKG